jgi:hypothetical protein
MDLDFLLGFAQRMREMMGRAHTEIAREQLRIWAEEFEERAAKIEARRNRDRRPSKAAELEAG